MANDEIDEQGDIEGTNKSADVLEHVESVQDGENLDDIGNVELSNRLELSTGVVVNVEACVDASGVNSGEKRAAENTLVQNPRKNRRHQGRLERNSLKNLLLNKIKKLRTQKRGLRITLKLSS